MSSFVQGGVYGATSKKALKDAVKADASSVIFYGTSAFGSAFEGPVSTLPAGITLTVVGPDPYRKRTWYASIVVRSGKVVVS